jgi:hypothetical protein
MRNLLRKMILPLCLIACCIVFYGCGKESAVHTYYTVGEYSGHRVDFVRIEPKYGAYAAVVVKYCVDDVYIMTMPDPGYDYAVYINDKDFLLLQTAYEQGYITHDDLLAIAEAEAPHDTLKDEDNLKNIPR